MNSKFAIWLFYLIFRKSWTHSLQRSGTRKAAVDVNTFLRPHLRNWSWKQFSGVINITVVVDDDTYYRVYLSSEHRSISSWQLKVRKCYHVITRCDIFFITKCDKSFYKVRQNRPEVRLSCEYLINLLRWRFQNYYTILQVINKTLFKTRVVLNY